MEFYLGWKVFLHCTLLQGTRIVAEAGLSDARDIPKGLSCDDFFIFILMISHILLVKKHKRLFEIQNLTCVPPANRLFCQVEDDMACEDVCFLRTPLADAV